MSYEYSEDGLVEQATEDVLTDLGWNVKYAWHKETFGQNGLLGRENKSEVILVRYLSEALQKLNPELPEKAYTTAIDQIIQRSVDKSLAQINKEKYDLLKNGVSVKFHNAKNELITKKLRVFNFEQPLENDFLAVRQLEIVGEYGNRRPDIIGFVNGIPLVFFELKAHHTNIQNAYTQNLSDYKDTIPYLFNCNAFVILSNGTDARIGSITSPFKFFHEWKRINEGEEGIVSLDTMLKGVCDRAKLMDIFENFILFDSSGGSIAKIVAKNHQFIGVNKVLENVKDISDLKGKLGVFWHTQGSGKSYSMVFICQKILRKLGGAYTFLIVLDRSELERQIYDTFTGVGAVTEKNVKAKSRKDLKKLLQENHRYIFTLIHKFSIDNKKESAYPLITERENIIVISDEAHRTQGGVFARNMRYNAIPNASYLGFTGTPIIKAEEELTKNIFGEYVSVYDFKTAIVDGATLPLKYLNRGDKLDIHNPELDDKMAEILANEDLDDDQRRKLARMFSIDYPILTSEDRLRKIAKDLVWHFNDRGYQGKGMFVALDKPTAVRMYDFIQEYLPEYIADLELRITNCEDEQEELHLKRTLIKVKELEVAVVVSSEQNEIKKFDKMNLKIEPHRKKMISRDLETEFKDEDNNFRLVIVCAMWITGFDAPCVSTIYLDKPIKGHTLMQTIARANRVYDDEKENGLIVDYGNVYTKLKEAYSVYGEGGKTGGNHNPPSGGKPYDKLNELKIELELAINSTIDFLNEQNFDLSELINSTGMERLAKLKDAENAVKLNDVTRTKFEVLARNVFRKFKALYPEDEAKEFISKHNAIEAIYGQMNQKIQTADVTEVMMKLQGIVNDSVTVREDRASYNEIDISDWDFDKLRQMFEKTKHKQTMLFDLKDAVEKQMKRMIQQNPLRTKFYDKYLEIIAKYNKAKDAEELEKTFNEFKEHMESMSEEQKRATRENLDEESLAIYDLLLKENLTSKEKKQIKDISLDILKKLKDKITIVQWYKSTQIKSNVKITVLDALQWLPQESYSNDEVNQKTEIVYQHIFTNYQDGGRIYSYGT
jgi:type I restriction enzyme R subunit